MKYGKQIRKFREQLGMSQIELASMAGVTQAAISAIELGTIKTPSVGVAQKIAAALGVTVEKLFPMDRPAA
jgi:transcriptional regulator with XRE-family HTH domain